MRSSIITFIMIPALLLGTFSGCGKVREASQMVNAVKNASETAQSMAEGLDSEEIDLDNLEISEDDIRTFYKGISKLHDAYPEVSFEIAMTAALEISAQGKNLEKIVEKETDMSFQEYSAFSMAITMIQIEGSGVLLAEQMVAAMDEGMAQFDEMDTSDYTEEQLSEIETQRQALADAKAELDTPEYKLQKEQMDMVTAIRDEMGY